MLRVIALLPVLLLPPAVRAAETSTPLSLLAPGSTQNRFTVTLSAGGATDTKISDATGHFGVRMDIDPLSGNAATLAFEGGDVSLSNMSFKLVATVEVLPGFFLPVEVANLTTSNLGGFPSSPSGPQPLNDGAFDASLHHFTIARGTASGTTVASPEPISQNFADAPVSGPGVGSGAVVLEAVSENVSSRTFLAAVTLPVDFTASPEEGISLTVKGTLKAQGQVVVPKNPFLVWSAAAGLDGAAFDAEVRPGEPAGLLWALGLQADQPLAPHRPRAAGSQVSLTLPVSGTAAPLWVEISETLDAWSPADAADVSVAANPLPTGSTGVVTVEIVGPQRFVRLRADAP